MCSTLIIAHSFVFAGGVHGRHQDSRGVLDALRLDHVLDNSADPLRALDELGAEPFVGLPHVAIAEVF